MTEVVTLALQLAQSCGALRLYTIWSEVHSYCGSTPFTSAEIVAHALVPENVRLRDAIGPELSARKLGNLFATYEGCNIGGRVIRKISTEANAIVWACETKPESPGIDAAS